MNIADELLLRCLPQYAETLPVPHFTANDGALNLAAHLPTRAIFPEMGPRTNFTWAGRGSTSLHSQSRSALNSWRCMAS